VPGVRQSIVEMEGSEGGGHSPVAFVVAPGRSPRELKQEIRQALSAALPPYMIPETIYITAYLPLTKNGKVDREALTHIRMKSASHDPGIDDEEDASRGDETYNFYELKLLEIWKDIFENRDFSKKDSFFDAGGDSIRVLRYLDRIQKQFATGISLAEVYNNPTIEGMARCLQRGASEKGFRSLVPLAPAGKGIPIFFTHGVGGELFIFTDLARRIGKAMPVYGLQAIEWSGSSESCQSIEEAAQNYAREIQKFWPEGPCRLTGFSMGGMIAYETARQLRNAGRTVSFLGIVDTFPPNLPRLLHYQAYLPGFFHALLRHVRIFLQMKRGRRRQYIRERMETLQFMRKMNQAKRSHKDNEPKIAEDELTYYLQLYQSYYPHPSELKACLFLADQHRYRIERAWSHLARGGVRTWKFKGGHSDFFLESNIGDFSDLFLKAISHSEENS